MGHTQSTKGMGQSQSEPASKQPQVPTGLFSWMYADVNIIAYENPLRWSTKKSYEKTLEEVQKQNPAFDRPVYVKEYSSNGERTTYKASSFQDLRQHMNEHDNPDFGKEKRHPDFGTAKRTPQRPRDSMVHTMSARQRPRCRSTEDVCQTDSQECKSKAYCVLRHHQFPVIVGSQESVIGEFCDTEDAALWKYRLLPLTIASMVIAPGGETIRYYGKKDGVIDVEMQAWWRRQVCSALSENTKGLRPPMVSFDGGQVPMGEDHSVAGDAKEAMYYSNSQGKWIECIVIGGDADGGIRIRLDDDPNGEIAGFEKTIPPGRIATHFRILKNQASHSRSLRRFGTYDYSVRSPYHGVDLDASDNLDETFFKQGDAGDSF